MDNIKVIVLICLVPLILNLAILCALFRRRRQPYDHFAHLKGRMGTIRENGITLCKAKTLRVTHNELFTTYGRFTRTARIETGDDGRHVRTWQATHDPRITFTFDA